MRILILFLMLNLTKNTLGVKKSCGQELEKGLDEKEVKSKMGGQGLCSATTDQNKILIITSQAAKHYVINRNVLRPDLWLLKFYFDQ